MDHNAIDHQIVGMVGSTGAGSSTGRLIHHPDTLVEACMASPETQQLTWRSGDTGTLEDGRRQPGHHQAGMRGQLTITCRRLPAKGQQP